MIEPHSSHAHCSWCARYPTGLLSEWCGMRRRGPFQGLLAWRLPRRLRHL